MSILLDMYYAIQYQELLGDCWRAFSIMLIKDTEALKCIKHRIEGMGAAAKTQYTSTNRQPFFVVLFGFDYIDSC